jgi:hypothetical protein
MTPAPPEKTAVRLELFPETIEEGLATKLVITGAAVTVTVAVWVMAVPTAGVTMRVYVVVVVGLTLTAVPLVTARFPGVMTPAPPEKTAVRLELAPDAMDAGLATKLVITGAGVTVTVVVAVIELPLLGVTVRV